MFHVPSMNFTPPNSGPIWGIRTPGLGPPPGYRGPMNGWKEEKGQFEKKIDSIRERDGQFTCPGIICECGVGGWGCGEGCEAGWVGGDGLIAEFCRGEREKEKKGSINNGNIISLKSQLTGKKPCGMGPPGIPSPGAIWPSGLGTGPAFYMWRNKKISHIPPKSCLSVCVCLLCVHPSISQKSIRCHPPQPSRRRRKTLPPVTMATDLVGRPSSSSSHGWGELLLHTTRSQDKVIGEGRNIKTRRRKRNLHHPGRLPLRARVFFPFLFPIFIPPLFLT